MSSKQSFEQKYPNLATKLAKGTCKTGIPSYYLICHEEKALLFILNKGGRTNV